MCDDLWRELGEIRGCTLREDPLAHPDLFGANSGAQGGFQDKEVDEMETRTVRGEQDRVRTGGGS